MPQSDKSGESYYMVQTPYCNIVIIKAGSSEEAIDIFRNNVNKHPENHKELIKSLVTKGAMKLFTKKAFKELAVPVAGLVVPECDENMTMSIPSYRGLCKAVYNGIILGWFELKDDTVFINSEKDGQ